MDFPKYDYDWSDDDSDEEEPEGCFVIFEVKGGKVVARAQSKTEALELIRELEEGA